MKEQFNINMEILNRLAKGMTQKEISIEFKKLGITPNSFSIIDKRMKAIREQFNCKTAFQLMYKLGKAHLLDE